MWLDVNRMWGIKDSTPMPLFPLFRPQELAVLVTGVTKQCTSAAM